jgi:hypothetical protein
MFRAPSFILRETLQHRCHLSRGNLSRGRIGNKSNLTKRMMSITRQETKFMTPISVRALDLLSSITSAEVSILKLWNLDVDEKDDDGG